MLTQTATGAVASRWPFLAKATRPSLALIVVILSGSGCLDDSITGTRDVTFSFSASPTSASVGQTIVFSYEGTGTRIQGVIVEFGDGVVDSLFTPGTVVEVSSAVEHAYATAGTFEAVARLETLKTFLSDTLTIQVNPP